MFARFVSKPLDRVLVDKPAFVVNGVGLAHENEEYLVTRQGDCTQQIYFPYFDEFFAVMCIMR